MHYKCSFLTLKWLHLRYNFSVTVLCVAYIDGILPKGPYPPCLHMADRALLAGYPRYILYFYVWKYPAQCPKYSAVPYNKVIFLQNSPKRRIIARPLGLDMACALVVSISDLYSTPIIAVMYAIFCCTGLRYNGTQLYTVICCCSKYNLFPLF